MFFFFNLIAFHPFSITHRESSMASQEPRMEMVNGEMVLHFTNFSGSIVIKSSTKEQQTKRELTSASSNVGSSNCGNKRVFDAATNSKDQGDKKIDAEKEKENKPSSHAEEQKLASPSPQKPLTTSASSLSAAAVSSSSSSSSSRKTKKARKDGKSRDDVRSRRQSLPSFPVSRS